MGSCEKGTLTVYNITKEVKTTDENLQNWNMYGTDTNKDTMWTQVASHVIKETFAEFQLEFINGKFQFVGLFRSKSNSLVQLI